MHKLFEKLNINTLVLKNRFILSAAYGPKEKIESFKNLAKGGVGLIITGGLELNEIGEFKKVIEEVHKLGGKIALQLVSGIGGRFGFDENALDTIAVSHLDKNNVFFNPFVKYSRHHDATEEEIERIVDEFVQGAVLAKSIKADAIQIHSAHQSFLLQFLSPITNRRKDRWGGLIENRTRIHKLIYDSIRLKVGDNFPILIKLGVEDGFDEGLKFSEGKKIAELIASYGFDAIEISQGLQNIQKIMELNDWSGTPMRINLDNIKKEAYFSSWCREIKKLVSVPIIMSGGLKSFEKIAESFQKNEADLFGLCRPLIREPALVKRWESGDLKKASCISCNKCLTEIYLKGNPLECFLDLKKN